MTQELTDAIKYYVFWYGMYFGHISEYNSAFKWNE